MDLISTPLRKLREVWVLAVSERASPKEIGVAVGLGCFVGFSPALGFHGALALACATALRKNRLFCWLGSRSSNVLLLPFITYAQVQIAHRLRTGAWLEIDRAHILDHTGQLLFDWFLGMIPVGVPAAVLTGLVAFAWAKRREQRIALREASAASA